MCRFFTQINLNRGLGGAALAVPSILGLASFVRGDALTGSLYLGWLIGTIAGLTAGYGMKENRQCPLQHVADNAVVDGPVIIVEIEGDGEQAQPPAIQMVPR